MHKFVLAGTQRAGTSLVNSTLNSHSRIRCYGEVFLYAKGKGRNMPGSYRRFVESRGWRGWLQHYLNRPASMRRCLDELYALDGFDAVGFKLMLSQALRDPAIVDYLVDLDVKVVFLVRWNVLKTHLSRVSAKKRGLYISKEKVNVEKVRIDTKHLLRHLQAIAGEQLLWRRIFSKLRSIEVFYEDVVKDKPAQLARIEQFLGVGHEELATPVVKINPDDMRQYVENYDEVASCLRGTEFEQYLT